MGFYGNISNVNKTNMTFDKIYSNRKSMDESCALDGVYAGRYVLVEYEQYYPLDTLPIIYKLNSDKEEKFSTTYTQFSPLDIQENVIYRCVILTNWLNSVIPVEELLLQYYSNTFYRGVQKDGVLSLENVSSEISEENYVGNFNIDRIEYNTSRGYDSTVWMKQYDSNGIPRYVNIAELNSVIPTFDVSVDAPTMEPQSPHFDADSTNIYYNLHVQPQWGFRIKEATRKNANGGIISDAMTEYTSITYDENGAEIITSTDVDADIYFNKAGFDKNNRKAYVDLETVGEDSIGITPTGVSGQLYNSHEKGQPKQEAPDIQELSINLPSIGNMMSEAWDYIYGPERDSYMGQWKTKEDLVDESIFTNNAIDNEGYILEGGKRKDFSSFDGRLKSISLCEGETIPVKRSSDGRIVGARLNSANQDRINFLEAEWQDALINLEERWAAGEFATDELYNAEKARINKNYSELIEAYRETDEWIATAIDSENLNITIEHKTKFEENQTNSRSTQSPSFGSSFNIPIITVDKAGHITSLEGNSSVQLPQGSLTINDETNNVSKVITDLSFTPATGSTIAKSRNVGELLLTDYEQNENGYITAQNSINQAFKTLDIQAQVYSNSIAAINDANNGILAQSKAYTDSIKASILGEGIKDTFDTLVEIQTWIEGDGVDVKELTAEMAKIPSWAKESTKPTYTAEEVGALPATTVIPTIPTDISAFNNDVGYLTEHQSLKTLEDKIAELEERIAQLENPTTTE